jgi:radical SAM-linked protein
VSGGSSGGADRPTAGRTPRPRPAGPPPAPVAQRLRVQYARRDRMRFASHRDFARALERAVRRAGLPVASSAGFSPHPRISYLGAAPTGTASEAEYLEIGLTEPVPPAGMADRLQAHLPAGFHVLRVVEATGPPLADRIDASEWQIRLPATPAASLRAALADFLRREQVLVERVTRDGRRTLDVRAAVAHATVVDDPGAAESCGILELVVRHGSPAVRPDDVLTGIRETTGLPLTAPQATRRAQGLLDAAGRLADPLAGDSVPVQPARVAGVLRGAP